MIRSFLRGAFANTAFCVLAPDGKTRLSRGGRSPSVLLGRGKGDAEKAPTIAVLERIAAKYTSKGSTLDATLQDFHTTRQAVNVASGDQRLLLLTVGEKAAKRKSMVRAVLNSKDAVGRYHHDFVDAKAEKGWQELVSGENAKEGFLIVQADAFGLEAKVLSQLPVNTSEEALQNALSKANKGFASSEKRKSYSAHVRSGRRKGIHFKNEIPYGEDRDGDRVIDDRGGAGRRR